MLTLLASAAAFACAGLPGPTAYALEREASADAPVQIYLTRMTSDQILFNLLGEDGSVTPLQAEPDPICSFDGSCLLTIIPNGVPGDRLQGYFHEDVPYEGGNRIIDVTLVDLPTPDVTESASPTFTINEVTEYVEEGLSCDPGDKTELDLTIEFGDAVPVSFALFEDGVNTHLYTGSLQGLDSTTDITIKLREFGDRCVSLARIFRDGSVGEVSEEVCTGALNNPEDPADNPIQTKEDSAGCSSVSAPVSLGAFIGLMLLGARRRS